VNVVAVVVIVVVVVVPVAAVTATIVVEHDLVGNFFENFVK
jgi:hypothetical protein